MKGMPGMLTFELLTAHAEGCIHCNLCSMECNWSVTSPDPHDAPLRRSDLVRRLLKGKQPAESDLTEMKDLFYRCTMCGRCASFCPQGVSNRELTRYGRYWMTTHGHAPGIVNEIVSNSAEYHNSFGMPKAIFRALEIAEKAGVHVPTNKEGATWLMCCSAIALKNVPHDIVTLVNILDAIGADYTVSTNLSDTGTEANTTAVLPELGREFLVRLCEEAKRLGCRGILVGECGCDVRTTLVEYGGILRRYGLEAAHVDSLILEAFETGRIKPEPLELTATYHYPCWSARLSGYASIGRKVLGRCVSKVIDLVDDPRLNLCCNGGAGMMRFWTGDNPDSPWVKACAPKAAQLEIAREKGATHLFSPCVTCCISLGRTVKNYGVSMEVELLANAVRASLDPAFREARYGQCVLA